MIVEFLRRNVGKGSPDFVIPSEARDLHCVADCRSLASLDWITTLARRSE